mmetsp:Transcript_47734/g.103873  ORF Transcript_47734/g.103873 Transcript_47734/m.103873 type:complete len:267 (+) Transcript_47734:746-1546(+)
MLVQPRQRDAFLINRNLLQINGIWLVGCLAVPVPDPAAREKEDTASTAPHPNRHLNVLSAPLQLGFIIPAHIVEKLLGHRKDSPSHCGGRIRVRISPRTVAFISVLPNQVRQCVVESANVVPDFAVAVELRIPDDVNQRVGDHCRITGDSSRKRFEPAWSVKAMRLSEGNDLGRGVGRSDTSKTCPNNAASFRIGDHPDFWVHRFQLFSKNHVRFVCVIHKNDLIDSVHGSVFQDTADCHEDVIKSFIQIRDDHSGFGQRGSIVLR